MGCENCEARKAVTLRQKTTTTQMRKPNALLLLLALTLTACHGTRPDDTAQTLYERALEALATDSTQTADGLLHQAISHAQQEKDTHTLYLAQLKLAQQLAWGNTAEALGMAKAALRTYETAPDSRRNHIRLLDYVGTYAGQLAYTTEAPYDEAISYTRRALDMALAARDTLGDELVSQTETSMANLLWATEQYAEALRHARRGVETAPDSALLLGAKQVLARCLASCGSTDAAETVYRSMKTKGDIQAAYVVESSLAKLALHRRDMAAAEAALDDAFEHVESLYFEALGQKDAYYRTALARERENERLTYRNRLHRRTLWGGLTLMAALLAAAAFALRTQMRDTGRKRLSEVWARKHEVDESIRQSRLREAEAQLHRQRSAAQEELLHSRDATIRFLKDFILQRSIVVQKLGASADRHVYLTEHEWQEMERTIDAIDGSMFEHLRQRYPMLREEDVQLCLLTRLRLSNRAIGNIYGLTISAVQHRKLKLKKEVFGEEQPEVTLEQVLDNIRQNINN